MRIWIKIGIIVTLAVVVVIAIVLLLMWLLFVRPSNQVMKIQPMLEKQIVSQKRLLSKNSSEDVSILDKKSFNGKLKKPLLQSFSDNMFRKLMSGVDSKSFTSIYKSYFQKHMDKPFIQKRGKAFAKIFEHLESKQPEKIAKGQGFTIIETGTTRSCANPDVTTIGAANPINPKDGNLTLFFDFFVNMYGGKLYSCDIDMEACQSAAELTTNKTKVFVNDSVRFLNDLNPKLIQKADLIFLDSLDFNVGNMQLSPLHHMFELATIFKNLRPGTLLAVDDNPKKFPMMKNIGKGMYVKKFFQEHFGIEPWIDDYVLVYKI